MVLPNHYAGFMRKRPDVSASQSIASDFFAGWPGFESMAFFRSHENVIISPVRQELTRSFALIMDSFVKDTRFTVDETFGCTADWQHGSLKLLIGKLVARISSFAFLGPELCQNDEWLEIARNYTTEMGQGARNLSASSQVFRPITYWLDPHCKQLRSYYRRARHLLGPEVEKRKDIVKKALAAGEKPENKTFDTIGWMVAQARGRDLDYAAAQLLMVFAGIHTTTESLTAAMVDICEHPEVVQPLRDEIVKVIAEYGWSRQALLQMRQLDSFMKESQRMHAPLAAAMGRRVLEDITLPDGNVLPKGALSFVAPNFFNPETFVEPAKFEATRFLDMRDASGTTGSWQHTGVNPGKQAPYHGNS